MKLFAFGRQVKREEEAAIETARAALLKVNLWRLADAPAATLSGGQKKLLELSRALMLRPRLVLLDEPAAGVAPAMEEILVYTIRGLAAEGADSLSSNTIWMSLRRYATMSMSWQQEKS